LTKELFLSKINLISSSVYINRSTGIETFLLKKSKNSGILSKNLSCLEFFNIINISSSLPNPNLFVVIEPKIMIFLISFLSFIKNFIASMSSFNIDSLSFYNNSLIVEITFSHASIAFNASSFV
jgi:hypothetical protein